MIRAINVCVYPVDDLARAKALFSKVLGVAPFADTPYYVGFKVGDQEIGLDPNGHMHGMTGPVEYWEVDDINESLRSFLDGGAETQQEVTDVGGGKLIATVRDAEGNVIGLTQLP